MCYCTFRYLLKLARKFKFSWSELCNVVVVQVESANNNDWLSDASNQKSIMVEIEELIISCLVHRNMLVGWWGGKGVYLLTGF